MRRFLPAAKVLVDSTRITEAHLRHRTMADDFGSGMAALGAIGIFAFGATAFYETVPEKDQPTISRKK